MQPDLFYPLRQIGNCFVGACSGKSHHDPHSASEATPNCECDGDARHPRQHAVTVACASISSVRSPQRAAVFKLAHYPCGLALERAPSRSKIGLETTERRMKIGELAKCSGFSGHTIRSYERIGLLPRPGRDQSNQRDYDAERGHALQPRLYAPI